MKIFVSWSGPVSRDVAHAVQDWLKLILQATDPWISDDAAKGSVWFNGISQKIKDSGYGVVCVTEENKREPWLLFEAGALYGAALYGGFAREQFVVPLLINLKKSAVGTPLNQFQMLEVTDKKEVTAWLKDINKTLTSGSISEQQIVKLVDKFWQELQDAVAKAIADHPRKLNADGNEPTFKMAADKTLDDLRARGKEKSVKRYQSSLKHLAPYLDHMAVSQIDMNVLEQYRADRVSGKLLSSSARGPAMTGTVNKDLRLVLQVLNYAKRRKWLSEVPEIRLDWGDMKQPHTLSWADQDAVFSHLPAYTECAYEFAVNTGLRREQIANLKWSQEVKLPDGTSYFTVPLEQRAQGKMRSVPLNSIARRIVEAQRDKNDEYVFTNFRNNQYANYGIIHWTRAWKRAKLPSGKMVSKGVENLRKTFEFRLRNARVPEAEIDILLGSTKGTVLDRTAVVPVGPLVEHVEKITVRDDVIPPQLHGQSWTPVTGLSRRKKWKRQTVANPAQLDLT